jgi:hypothetical protein
MKSSTSGCNRQPETEPGASWAPIHSSGSASAFPPLLDIALYCSFPGGHSVSFAFTAALARRGQSAQT